MWMVCFERDFPVEPVKKAAIHIIKTSLLRRLQAQTLPGDALTQIDKIHPFNKMAVTFQPLMGF